jgi:hypothetical protein
MPSLTIAKVGRNERCPCGSGKKYKQCCLRTEPVSADTAWRRQRTASDRLTQDLLSFLRREFTGSLSEAWQAFNLTAIPPLLDELPGEEQIFWPWFLHDWDPDRSAQPQAQKTQGGVVVRSFLRKAASRLSELELLILEQACTQPVSFYDVVFSEPGQRIVLRDILIGGETEVIERSAARVVRAGDVCYSPIQRLPEVNTLGRTAPVAIPPSRKVEIIRLRARLREKIAEHGRDLAAQDLVRYTDDIRAVYLSIRDAMRQPPILINTDGDRLLMHTMTYRVESAQAAFDALASLAWGVTKEDLWEDAEFNADGTLARVEIVWGKDGNEKFKTWDNTTLGRLMIDGQEMVATVNSAERAQTLRGEIERRLGSLAVHQKTVRETPEELVKARKLKDVEPVEESADSTLDPDLLREAQEMIQRQAEGWVTNPLPVLGGRTPLEAVGDPDGREMVEALLLEWDRNFERSARPGSLLPDAGAVRRLLHLA